MFHSVQDNILSLKQGNMILLIDDCTEGKELGYCFILSECVSPESINFMIKHARGLVSIALTAQRAKELNLPLMARDHESSCKNFTISVDYKDTTTGISAYERSETIRALIKEDLLPEDLKRPGHIFPLVPCEGGLIKKVGIAEVAIDLARVCESTYLSGAFCEVLNDKGFVASLTELKEKAFEFNLKVLSLNHFIAYLKKNMALINREIQFTLPTKYGEFQTVIYTNRLDDSEYIVIVEGTGNGYSPIPVYMDSGHTLGEVFVANILEELKINGRGVFVYRKKSSIKNMDSKTTEKEWDNIVVEQILKDIGVTNSIIMTNVSLV